MSKEMVTISREEYDEVVEEARWMRCYRNSGVDNWEGADMAIELMREEYPEYFD